MDIGDVYKYKDDIVEGEPSDNHVVIGITENYILCLPEKSFDLSYLDKLVPEFFNLPIRKIAKYKFTLWYPEYLYNIYSKNPNNHRSHMNTNSAG